MDLDREMPLVLVVGLQAGEPPPGLPESETGARYVMAPDLAAVRASLEQCEIVFHYGPPLDALRSCWRLATRLRWLHIGSAGVDWALFPELVASDVTVTNSRGVFDTPLSEYVLALMLALVKDVPGTMQAQAQREWHPRVLGSLVGGRAVIVGAGSVAQATGRLLRSMGMHVLLVGRSGRQGGPGEGWIHAVADLHDLLPTAGWLIVAAPSTSETKGLIGREELLALPSGARLVNVGRGSLVVEEALVEAVRSGHLAGAALDVFEQEPLSPESPLWSLRSVIVSPHTGGTTEETPSLLSAAFLDNLRRYIDGRTLSAVVDKRLGYVRSPG
jgi:phosphoglycerate dehydrogenase-like enzyme